MLDQLKALEAAATPGPWIIKTGTTRAIGAAGDVVVGLISNQADAELSRAARNALPDLIAVAEAAREWVDYQVYEKRGLFRDGIPGDLMDALTRLEAKK